MFQSTLPYGERRSRRFLFMQAEGFNPRSRMGSDSSHNVTCLASPVSIHAPVWGATSERSSGSAPLTFQSTLPYGERHRSK